MAIVALLVFVVARAVLQCHASFHADPALRVHTHERLSLERRPAVVCSCQRLLSRRQGARWHHACSRHAAHKYSRTSCRFRAVQRRAAHLQLDRLSKAQRVARDSARSVPMPHARWPIKMRCQRDQDSGNRTIEQCRLARRRKSTQVDARRAPMSGSATRSIAP